MKINKSQLKGIVKECLVEILSEGIGKAVTTNSRSSERKKSTHLDKIRFEEKRKKAVKQKVSSLTSDPVMAALFEDTANTTLLEQSERSSAGSNTPGQPQVPIEDIPGANNWATLAFDN
jgi:hypothetical protein